MQKLLRRTTSGNVGINNTLIHVAQDDLPFGGIGPSGMGAYHGIEGFRSMSHAKVSLIRAAGISQASYMLLLENSWS